MELKKLEIVKNRFGLYDFFVNGEKVLEFLTLDELTESFCWVMNYGLPEIEEKECLVCTGC